MIEDDGKTKQKPTVMWRESQCSFIVRLGEIEAGIEARTVMPAIWKTSDIGYSKAWSARKLTIVNPSGFT